MDTTPTPEPTRWLALGGPAYVVLLVAAAVAFPAAPGGDVAPAEDPAWLARHTGAVIAQGWVRSLAALAFVVLAVAVGAAVDRTDARPSRWSRLALAGGVLTGGLMAAAQASALASALAVTSSNASGSVRLLGAMQEALLDASSLPATLLFLGLGVGAWSSRVLPRWVCTLSLLGVPVALVDSASYDGGPLAAVSLLGLVYFLAWSLVVGALLFRGASRPAELSAGRTSTGRAGRTR